VTSSSTLAGLWNRAVRSVPDNSFLRFEDADGIVTDWTYAGFDALVVDVAARLRPLGVGHGSGVHLCLTNSPSFVALWLAAARMGAFIVPVDPSSSPREVTMHVERVRPIVGVCSESTEAAYREGVQAAGQPVVVLRSDSADTELSSLRDGAGEPASHEEGPSPETPAAVMFTSGTTAAPKGVVVTQGNYAFAGEVMAGAAALRADDRQLVVLPLFHANAQYYSFAPAMAVGASVALMSRFSASRFLEQAARHRATHASLFAAPMRMILAKRPARPAEGTLRHVWYAQNVTQDQYAELTSLLGCRPRQLYGMTETIPAVLTNPQLSPVHDALGYPTLGCKVTLEREDGGPVDGGEVGQIVVGGRRGRSLFAGYLDDEKTTATSFGPGGFRTGDLAWQEPGGPFRFAGRGSDVLKVAGENVSTVEIETVLCDHPSVLEAAVVGAPDPFRDEVPVAYVVPTAGGEIDVATLESWCRDHLAAAKRPQRIVVLSELPRTSVGKVRKFELR
jgi:carnitine-CoA ligase